MRAKDILPDDGCAGTLVGRIWMDGDAPGPRPVAVRDDGLFDLSALAPTLSDLFEMPDPAAQVAATPGVRLGSLEDALSATFDGRPALLAPCDLQAIKAAGVTFAHSLLERVIEERAGGDARAAAALRADLAEALGDEIANVAPGSPAAARLKATLIAKGLWSQYLEVGIGPDAEIFTKAQPMSAVGAGAQVGLHPTSQWNNPEPEVVLACSSAGAVVGAALGNDVNLRDIEGRSALLLSKAKDNNASCAIGPFVRLFDRTFSLDDVRAAELQLTVTGQDGYVLRGSSSMRRISRDPLELVRQTCGPEHQYPDGFMLFLGTLFAPTEDRDTPGGGFTHKEGDRVVIRAAKLGALSNVVTTSDRAPPWRFGARALMRSLARRGLL
ncbi:MAG: fumarylacetoacetate hydrolase family protein [Phenylobacterium sp.]|uniref:fumarylacetoacetate hydrolase family protein n=1 Tax=Phenylobacterium sp. TaxID=1871053 RepID=UPI001A61C2CF|nr:fumarylacetoacetate hydrolase family protein [Phenylobacterium sp.]MBL8773305.1 fumarylacetoacetate hydrolase family protein [Phenylobacterium sp.]